MGTKRLKDAKSHFKSKAKSMVLKQLFLSSFGNPRIKIPTVSIPKRRHNLNAASILFLFIPDLYFFNTSSLALSTPNITVWQPALFIDLNNSISAMSVLRKQVQEKSPTLRIPSQRAIVRNLSTPNDWSLINNSLMPKA